ncbi:uncharacterized protein [Aegilops tauschii subsp. strangulata]|uniref:uncharacterized protein n=1 Tax=Aegilops tauschii subsp. strangulata TaxID=200361 RepID=UPI001ABC9C4C|nr:uncharacterized protein LOC120974713 isoform X2 [Aegilops tauschii subsp. strangulata]
MGKGEAAMAQRGGGEEGRANTKLGEGHLPDEEQQGDQQQNPQERSMMRAVIEEDLMRLSYEELILIETFSFTALLHSDIMYKVHSGDGSTNIAETIYENSRSKSNDSFITIRDDNTLEADLHHEMPASEDGGENPIPGTQTCSTTRICNRSLKMLIPAEQRLTRTQAQA